MISISWSSLWRWSFLGSLGGFNSLCDPLGRHSTRERVRMMKDIQSQLKPFMVFWNNGLNFDQMDLGMLSDQIGKEEKTVKLEARRALDCHFSSSCLFQNRSAFRFPELFHSSSFSELGGFLEGRQKPSVQTTIDEVDKNEITSKRDFGNSDCAC